MDEIGTHLPKWVLQIEKLKKEAEKKLKQEKDAQERLKNKKPPKGKACQC
jgi:hypothetical protein